MSQIHAHYKGLSTSLCKQTFRKIHCTYWPNYPHLEKLVCMLLYVINAVMTELMRLLLMKPTASFDVRNTEKNYGKHRQYHLSWNVTWQYMNKNERRISSPDKYYGIFVLLLKLMGKCRKSWENSRFNPVSFFWDLLHSIGEIWRLE